MMFGVQEDRERLRVTFDSAAGSYHQARPDYPDELVDLLVRLADLRPGAQLLEVGCGTGKATLALASRGFAITCIELGAELAAAAERNLAGHASVHIVHGAFESWQPLAGQTFDLVFAATAWHWIDPAVKYRRAWELLRTGGHLAFWAAAHVIPGDGDPFFVQIQDVYDEIGEGVPRDRVLVRPGELADERAEIEASGFFEDVQVRHIDWEISYDADGYIGLLETFSGHIAMQPWQRERLYGEIRRRLAERPDGRLRRHWGAVLHVARRREMPRDEARHGGGTGRVRATR